MKNPHLNNLTKGVPNDLGLGVPPRVLHSIDRGFSPKDNVVSR